MLARETTSIWLPPLTLFLLCVIGASASCGYESCPVTKANMLNVHLIPHTHDDVGWLKTVDQYFYGSEKDIDPAGVQYILDSVIPALQQDPRRRFIYVEVAFFWRWWQQQTDAMRHQVRNLVNNGQLEFINGGWCMNDEAGAHYNAIIDQMTWGFRKLNDTFGECGRPRVAWQIDPFGHSREQASLFAQMGFDGLFFGRLDYQDKEKRMREKTMELVWKGSDSLGRASYLYTGVNYNLYQPPPGFCFDIFCDDDPIRDDLRLHDYNVPERVRDFIKLVDEQAKSYASNHIYMTMGSDFQYNNANTWYKNLDKLIKHVNANSSRINLLYSTPSCYLKAFHDAGLTLPTKTDDFFPYGSDPHAYWSGYFTSRPALKGMIRYGNNFLQICKQIGALTSQDWTPGPDGDVTVLREAMGTLQHHDAVTGTAKQAVTFDYAQRLYHGFEECQKVVDYAYKNVMPVHKAASPPEQQFCHLLNITQCHVTETSDRFVVSVYNPLDRQVSKFVRLPVVKTAYSVRAPNGDLIDAQIVAVPAGVKKIPGRASAAEHELVFRADVAALGYKSFFIQSAKSHNSDQLSKGKSVARKTFIGNEQLSLSIDRKGLVKQFLTTQGSINFNHTLGYYEGRRGNNSRAEFRASGAYIFRPLQQRPHLLSPKHKPLVFKGPVVEEVHLDYGPTASQVVRVYAGQGEAEFEWIVGPIPVEDGVGKEYIARYSTDLKTDGLFYTDANGRQMMKRKRNFRPTWHLNLTEPVASNYYPVNSRAFLRDTHRGTQMTVLTDRSQGGSSLKDGELELMVHRRLLDDDAFGVGEALNEMAYGQGLVVRGKHWVQLAPGKTAARKHRFKAQQVFMDSLLTFAPTTLSFDDWKRSYNMEFSALIASSLPANIHILTLEEWHGNSRDSVLLRLEHFFDADEDPELSHAVTFNLAKVFSAFTITGLEEVTLGANLNVEKLRRMEWKVESDNRIHVEPASWQRDDNDDAKGSMTVWDITLVPMQIGTYILDLQPLRA